MIIKQWCASDVKQWSLSNDARLTSVSCVHREAGINVHDVLPVTTPRGKQMMPPADRIYDPGQGAKKDLTDTGDKILAHDNNNNRA